jgi:hypothetical protein
MTAIIGASGIREGVVCAEVAGVAGAVGQAVGQGPFEFVGGEFLDADVGCGRGGEDCAGVVGVEVPCADQPA